MSEYRRTDCYKKFEALIEEVLVPTEEVVEIRRGAKVQTEKIFPGYILIKMEMTDGLGI